MISIGNVSSACILRSYRSYQPLANSITIPITVLNPPQLFGQIGLQTAGAGTNLRVQFKGTVSVQLPLALVGITITVVRGTLATDTVIYSATSTFGSD